MKRRAKICENADEIYLTIRIRPILGILVYLLDKLLYNIKLYYHMIRISNIIVTNCAEFHKFWGDICRTSLFEDNTLFLSKQQFL